MNKPKSQTQRPRKPSRRDIAQGAAFVGYAAAIRPVNAAAITTPDTGLITGMVSYPSAGFDLPAFVARPAGRGAKPVVIVINEIFGLHDYIRDTCRRLAQAGYVAIAPAFFVRAGDPAGLTDFNAIMPIVAAATHAQVMGDIDATLAWLDQQSFVDRERIGMTGFCWGGTVVWMACAQNPRIKAGVAWYGRVLARAGSSEVRPWPVDVAPQLTRPVLGLYAEIDGSIPLESVDAMRTALQQSPSRASQIIVYPGTQHGFHADYRPQYHEIAAQDGWARLLAWFGDHLRAGRS